MKTYIKKLFLLSALISGLGLILAGRVTAQTFTNVHDFTGFYTGGPGGDSPQAGLILSGNTLYGTAHGGGSFIRGTVFKVNTNGTGFTVLHHFTSISGPLNSNSDGANPSGDLVLSGNTLYGTAEIGGSSGSGTVFAVNTDGTGFTTLHNFSTRASSFPYTNSDGAIPQDLILSGNTLYGTSARGGTADWGTVFSMNINGSGFTNLHNFTADSDSDGVTPTAGLILSGNTLYGTTYIGGRIDGSGRGTVFKMNTDGMGFTILHTFTSLNANSEGAIPYGGLVLSGNTLYGTARDGGSSGNGTVFAVNTDGLGFTNLHNFTAGSDGAAPVAALILSGTILYGTTSGGGSSGNGTMFAINTDGSGFRNLYSFTATPDYPPINSDGAHPQAGVILSGNTLYGTAASGGSAGNGTVFSLLLPPAPASTFQFSTASYNVGEGDTSALITVNRNGDISGTSTVDYASSNSTANQLKDYEVANGTLTFTAGQTSKTFKVFIVDDVFVEGNETVNLTLSNPTGAGLVVPSIASVTIVDNDTAGATSPVAKQFVANLTGADEVPATGNTVKGNGGIVQLSADEMSAKVSLLFSGLTGSETGAHIHGPAAPGVNAPILFPLPLGNPLQNEIINPTSAQVADLKAGLHYMNVHSSGFVNGEIRGQLQWNPAEEADFFVRQAYFDFLGRTPDAPGFAFWTGEITNCQSNVQCLRDKRVDVSNAFFYELEFQQTAAYVLRLYRGAYGNTQPFPVPSMSNPTEGNKIPSYTVFVADRARVIGSTNLAQKQLDLANLFVQRSEFTARYAASLATADQFVDAVLLTLQNDLGVNLSGQRTNLINLYNTQGGRGAVMYRLADDNAATNPIANQPFIDAEYNRTFVAGQYFGYLRRNPDIPGFVFWLGQVNGAPLRDVPRQHAMVCSFITSSEFQLRFGPILSRNNNECPQ